MAEDAVGGSGVGDAGRRALEKAVGSIDGLTSQLAESLRERDALATQAAKADQAATTRRAAEVEGAAAKPGARGAAGEALDELERMRRSISAAGPELTAFLEGERKRYAADPKIRSTADLVGQVEQNLSKSVTSLERSQARIQSKITAGTATTRDIERAPQVAQDLSVARNRQEYVKSLGAVARAEVAEVRNARSAAVDADTARQAEARRALELRTASQFNQPSPLPGPPPAATSGGGSGGGGGRRPPVAAAPAPGGQPERGDGVARATAQEQKLAAAIQAREDATVRARAAHQSMTLALDQSTNSLRSNGAMSQQFIQAAARGEASWREWGYQVSTVTAKFGAWALAGGAVYAMFDGIRRVGTGAIAGAGIEGGLGRVIDNLNTDKAQQAIRDLSRQYNVSMADAEQAVQLGAQQFNTLDGAVEAAKATLSSFKVGDLGIEEGSTYINAIAGGLGIASNQAGKLQGIFDQINEAQNSFNVSIPDTQKGLAKSVGVFTGAGGSFTDLLALITTGKRTTGRSGENVGTALQRAVGFIERPSNQATLQGMGIDTSQGISKTFDQAFQKSSKLISEGNRAGVREIAQALSSPQYASYLEPILSNEALYRKAQTGLSPEGARDSGQRELDKQLSRFSEKLSGIGNGLERFGAALAQSGLLNAAGALVYGFSALLGGVTSVVELFNNLLPSGIRNVLTGLLALSGVLAIARRQAPSHLVQQTGGPVGRLLGSSENATLKREIGRALRVQQTDLAQELTSAQRDARNVARRKLATTSELEDVANTRQGHIDRGERIPAVTNARYTHLQEQAGKFEDQEAAAKNRVAVATKELTIVDEQMARADQARTLAARQALAAESNLALSPRKDRPSRDPLVSRVGDGYVAHDPLREQKETAAREARAQANEARARAAYPEGSAQAERQAKRARERTQQALAIERQAPPPDPQRERANRFREQSVFQRVRTVVSDPEGPRDLKAAAATAYKDAGGVKGAYDRTGVAARSMAGRLNEARKGLFDMVGTLGLAVIGFELANVGLDKVLKSRGEHIDNANRVASSQDPNSREALQKQSEEDQRLIKEYNARNNPKGNYGPFGVSQGINAIRGGFNQLLGGGDAEADAAAAREQRLRTQIATVNTRSKKAGLPGATFIEDVTNKDGSGYADVLVKEQRAGRISGAQLRKGIAMAQKELEYVIGDSKARAAAQQKLREFDNTVAASLKDTALLGTSGLANTNLAAVQGQAEAASSQIGTGYGTRSDLDSSIRSNTAILSVASSQAETAVGEKRATALKAMVDARNKLTEDTIAYATDGLDQHLNLTRDQATRNGYYQTSINRLKQASSAIDKNPDRKAAVKQLTDAQNEYAKANAALTGFDNNKPTQFNTIKGPLGTEFKVPVDRLSLIKRVDTASAGLKQATAGVEAINNQTSYAKREIAAKIRELSDQRFEENEQNISAQVQAAASGAQRGTPTAAINLRAAHDAYMRAVEHYGKNSKEALTALSGYNAAQDAQASEQLALIDSISAINVANASGGTAQQQQAAATRAAADHYNAVRADPRSSQAEINNAYAALITQRHAAAKSVQDDTNAYIKAQGDYRKSLTDDPIKQAEIDLSTSNQLLKNGKFDTRSDRLNAKTDRNQKRTALRDTKNQSAYDDVEFMASVGKLTATQEIAALERLLRTRKYTKALKRQIQQKIYQLKNEANEGADSFNLDVGSLTIPSIAQIRRAVVGRQSGVSVVNQNSATVNVNNPSDIPAVARVLEDHNTGVGRAQARAMGVR